MRYAWNRYDFEQWAEHIDYALALKSVMFFVWRSGKNAFETYADSNLNVRAHDPMTNKK